VRRSHFDYANQPDTPKIFAKGFVSFVSYDTFAVLILRRFKKGNINAYHSATCKKRTDEIGVQIQVSSP
jgi:hypothetical protein